MMYKENSEDYLFYHKTQKWLNKVLDEEKTLYHYTSVDNLRNMIQSKCIYATHINFMNDWEEYKYGYKKLTNKLKKVLEEKKDVLENAIGAKALKDVNDMLLDDCPNVETYNRLIKNPNFMEFKSFAIPEIFTISFCKEKDLLSQWAIYAKESGVAIEFDFSKCVFVDKGLDEGMETEYEEDDWQQIKYHRHNRPHCVNYDEKKIDCKLKEQIDDIIREYEGQSCNQDARDFDIPTIYPFIRKIYQLYSIVPYFKTEEFSREDEIRVAFMRIKNNIKRKNQEKNEEYETKVFYRTANNVLKPFIKIGWEIIENSGYPIKRIIVGPGENQDAVYKGIIHFIENQENTIIPNDNKEPFSNSNSLNAAYLTRQGIKIEKSRISYMFK